MKCNKCHHDTPILVDGVGFCWECAFPRSLDLAAQQRALADERQAAPAKTA